MSYALSKGLIMRLPPARVWSRAPHGRRDRSHRRPLLALLAAITLAGCDVFDEELEQRVSSQAAADAGCKSHAECLGNPDSPRACVAGACVTLASEDCTLGAGDLSGDAIVIGALFQTTGPAAATNVARQQSALLAVEEINAVGGVPAASVGMRHLALVTCDAAVDVKRAARHLVDVLKVPAIVGPNTSQDTIAVTGEVSARGGTLLLTPTAVASSIADLVDENLTWMMVPTDEQRAPLMREQINALEAALRSERERSEIRVSIIYRNDALGLGTRVGLNSLVLNDRSLVLNQSATPPAVTIEPYDPALADAQPLVDRQREFAPDIVVLGGTAEAIERIMVPLEQGWGEGPRPYYFMIDSLRGPELLKAVAANDDLRRRVRGTGIVPTTRSAPVYDAFRLAYQTRYPGQPSTSTGMGPSYDAVHAIAYAIAATHAEPVSGASIARGLGRLHGGTLEVPLQSTKILSAIRELSQGRSIDAIGTYGPLDWDARGSPAGGRVEVWCIAGGSQPSYGSSGLAFDLDTRRSQGEYKQCEVAR